MILEWEHHWMHERGVCGCSVIFPDLIQPRVVGPSLPYDGPDQLKPEVNENKTVRKGKNKPTSSGPGRALPAPSMAKKTTNRGASSTGSENKPVGVSARVPSLYGAEWVDEHRQLHEAGSCECAGDFSSYKTPEAYGGIPCPPYVARAPSFNHAAGRGSFEGTSGTAYQHGQASSYHSGYGSNSSQLQQTLSGQIWDQGYNFQAQSWAQTPAEQQVSKQSYHLC